VYQELRPHTPRYHCLGRNESKIRFQTTTACAGPNELRFSTHVGGDDKIHKEFEDGANARSYHKEHGVEAIVWVGDENAVRNAGYSFAVTNYFCTDDVAIVGV
jgi:hypothetical protein